MKNLRSVFYEDAEVMAMLDVKDREELLEKVNKISTPDLALILKGDKGDVGPMGPVGEEGKDGESIIGPMGPRGRDGESIIGPKGENGKDSISTHTIETITEEVTVDDKFVKKVIAVMSKLPEKYKLDISALRNAGSFLFNGKRYKTEELMHGGGSSGGATTTFYSDTVSGTINSVNKVFTVPNTITTPLALWLANSIYQPTVDFTTSGTTITMVVAPDISLAGQPFWLSHT